VEIVPVVGHVVQQGLLLVKFVQPEPVIAPVRRRELAVVSIMLVNQYMFLMGKKELIAQRLIMLVMVQVIA
jgi:hypothetical protein